MQFTRHSELEGRHAFLSASQYSWINYTEEKLVDRFSTITAAAKGTELHNFASQAIDLGIKLPRNTKTLNSYVNDAIGFGMKTEQVLAYSENAFGTCDAIRFSRVRGSDRSLLRIHDLKTGVSPAKMDQLEVYTAFFCLEYRVRPSEIDVELRIYQNDEVVYHNPDLDKIVHIMDKIVTFDKIIKRLKEEALA